MRRRNPRQLAFILGAIGIALFAYKVFVLHFPVLPSAIAPVWTVEASVAFRANGKPVRASLFMPTSTAGFLVTNEQFVSRGFGLSTGSIETDRRAIWSAPKATGQRNLLYRAIVRQRDAKPGPVLEPPRIPATQVESGSVEVAQLVLAQIYTEPSDTRGLIRNLVALENRADPGANMRLLLGTSPTATKRAETAVALLGMAQVPARLVHGIALSRTPPDYGLAERTELVEWIEVYEENAWHPFNLQNGEEGIPDTYMPWWHGSEPLFRVEGADNAQASVSVAQHREDAMQSRLAEPGHQPSMLLDLSLFRLPVHTQMVYRVLLLIPIGALIVVMLRNMVGIKTFGTFMPVLIALAFRETHLLWGLFFFTVIVALGIAIRFYLGSFELLVVPRMASVLVALVLLVVVVGLLAGRFGLEEGISVALFPLVIMTMTVERMSTIWDELGMRAALSLGAGSLIVAALTYGVINMRVIEHLTFVFPELLLVVLGCCLMLGRYTGYRLMELGRFKDLAEAA